MVRVPVADCDWVLVRLGVLLAVNDRDVDFEGVRLRVDDRLGDSDLEGLFDGEGEGEAVAVGVGSVCKPEHNKNSGFQVRASQPCLLHNE
jgi:hypothetical protein